MSAYFEFLRGAASCRACPWRGVGRDCRVGEMFECGEITEYHCPRCGAHIAAAPWPTVEETKIEALTRSCKPLPVDHPLRKEVVFVPVPKLEEGESCRKEQPSGDQPLRYVVFVDSNFNYQDADERYEAGRFASLEAAVTECARRVTENLYELYQPGMDAEALFERYQDFGDDPFIVDTQNTSVAVRDLVPLCAWTYAAEMASVVVQMKAAQSARP